MRSGDPTVVAPPRRPSSVDTRMATVRKGQDARIGPFTRDQSKGLDDFIKSMVLFVLINQGACNFDAQRSWPIITTTSLERAVLER